MSADAASPVETSFVIIAKDEAVAIGETLDGIVAQQGLGAFEIVLVDDGSTDATAAIAEAHEAPVRVLRNAASRGRGAARAQAVAAASGREVAAVDADIVLPPDWLVRCRAALAQHQAVSGVAVPDGDVAFLYRRFGLTPKVVAQTTTVTGSNGLYRSTVFDQIGFDPELRNGEDVAFNHELERIGASTAVVPGLVVEHNEHKSFATSLSWMAESGAGASRQLWNYRRLRGPDLAFLGWLALILGALLGARRRPVALAAPVAYAGAAATAHLHRKFDLSRARPAALAGAVLTHTLFLTTYFLGRLAGAVRHRPS